MPSDIDKFLQKISQKERLALIALVKKISTKKLVGLDVKKLSGRGDVFRVRKGVYRIVFSVSKTDTKIITIERRSDTTYNL